MKTSDFQFTNPALAELEFYVNGDYMPEQEDIDIPVNMIINKNLKDELTAVVELCIEIGEKSESAPFYIKAKNGAFFNWKENAFNGEHDINTLLEVNAPALLLSYLRPVISSITGLSKYPAYNVPFVNFTEERRKSRGKQ